MIGPLLLQQTMIERRKVDLFWLLLVCWIDRAAGFCAPPWPSLTTKDRPPRGCPRTRAGSSPCDVLRLVLTSALESLDRSDDASPLQWMDASQQDTPPFFDDDKHQQQSTSNHDDSTTITSMHLYPLSAVFQYYYD